MARSGPERPRRAWRWLMGGHAVWVGLLLWCLGGAVQARVVGLVFDDSGSMGQQIQKALFAAQIVLGSLEAHDRLFVVRLNGGGGRIEEVPAARRAARTLVSMPPLPMPEPAPPAIASSAGSPAVASSMKRACGSLRGSAAYRPR